MTTWKTLVTAADLLEPPLSERRVESIRGQVVEMSPPVEYHGSVAAKFAFYFEIHAREHGGRALGEVSVQIAQDPDTVRIPDAAFVKAPRPRTESYLALENTPDVVVEVVSPNDRPGEVQAKAVMWLDAGAKVVWVAYPEISAIAVWRPRAESTLLRGDDVLDGGDVLPGFSVPVRDFFA